jgi:hypothetical protein
LAFNQKHSLKKERFHWKIEEFLRMHTAQPIACKNTLYSANIVCIVWVENCLFLPGIGYYERLAKVNVTQYMCILIFEKRPFLNITSFKSKIYKQDICNLKQFCNYFFTLMKLNLVYSFNTLSIHIRNSDIEEWTKQIQLLLCREFTL